MTRDLERSWDKLTQMKRKVTEAIQRANISLTRARENELARIVETVRAGTLPTVSRKEERLRQEVSSKHLLLEGIDRAIVQVGDELHAAIIPEEYHLAVALPDTDVSGEAARRHFEVARDREAARRRAGEERLAAAKLHNELVEKVNRAKWQHARSGQPEGAFDVTKYPSPEDAAALERDRARNVQVAA